ncbi:conserved hypothetical protein [Candidatus Brocadia pituitae]|nr:conserved hypothetical protein [Candidatus Brocadia pituitae]
MPNFLEEIEIQLHFWPWSVEIPEESISLTGGCIEFSFCGSPVLSISHEAKLYIPSRMEQFKQLGTSYDNARYQVYETPHGILAGQAALKKLRIRIADKTFDVEFNARDAAARFISFIPGSASLSQKTSIAKYVDAWSQVFDDLCDKATDSIWEYTSEISWSVVLGYLSGIAKDATREPRKALIVSIAEDMINRLPVTVASARKILLRCRDFAPIHRFQESDVHCLRWYVQQPGRTKEEKAGNKQRLLAVVRKESFNTLENQVLKDFINRCYLESSRYLQGEVTQNKRESTRAMAVQSYKWICNTSLKETIFEEVAKPPHGIRPNYVLQQDTRYKKVWEWYKKLLKREHVEDSLWDWQSRTWADVMRLLIGVALDELRKKEKQKTQHGFLFEPLANAVLHLRLEQERGSRIVPDSLPGPFLITRIVNGMLCEKMVLEIVHPDIAQKHQIVKHLGRVGGHLYMVLYPLGSCSIKKRVFVFWSVNGAGGIEVDSDKMAISAYRALRQHYDRLSVRRLEFPSLRGMIVVSSLKEQNSKFFNGEKEKLPVLIIPAGPETWASAVDKLCVAIEEMLKKCYE